MVSLTECLLLQVKSRLIMVGSVCHARCFPAMIKYFSSFIIGLSKFSGYFISFPNYLAIQKH